MTDKEYVQKYFPNSRCQVDDVMEKYDIWSGDFDHLFIGTALLKMMLGVKQKNILTSYPKMKSLEVNYETNNSNLQ